MDAQVKKSFIKQLKAAENIRECRRHRGVFYHKDSGCYRCRLSKAQVKRLLG